MISQTNSIWQTLPISINVASTAALDDSTVFYGTFSNNPEDIDMWNIAYMNIFKSMTINQDKTALHQSYYVKFISLQVLIPFFAVIHEKDAIYILFRKSLCNEKRGLEALLDSAQCCTIAYKKSLQPFREENCRKSLNALVLKYHYSIFNAFKIPVPLYDGANEVFFFDLLKSSSKIVLNTFARR